MKRMNCRLIAFVSTLLIALFLLSTLVLPASADGSYLDDGANVLSSSQAQEVERLLANVSEKYDCPVIVVTVNGQSDYTYESYAISLANQLDAQYGKAILFAHFPDIRAYQIEIRGSTFPMNSVERSYNKIRDAVLDRLQDDDYIGAYRAFADKSDYCLSALTTGKAVRDPYPFLRNIIIVLIVGLIAGLIYTSVLKKQLKSVAQDNRAANYVKDGSMNVTVQKDIFLYMHTTRVARPKESSSSGGGGFSSGGGRSSGGGGGGHY